MKITIEWLNKISLCLLLMLTGCGKYGKKLLDYQDNDTPVQVVQTEADSAEIPVAEISDLNRLIFLDEAFKTAKMVSVKVFVGDAQSIALPHINRTLDIEANYLIDRTMISIYNVKSAIPTAIKIRIEYIK